MRCLTRKKVEVVLSGWGEALPQGFGEGLPTIYTSINICDNIILGELKRPMEFQFHKPFIYTLCYEFFLILFIRNYKLIREIRQFYAIF